MTVKDYTIVRKDLLAKLIDLVEHEADYTSLTNTLTDIKNTSKNLRTKIRHCFAQGYRAGMFLEDEEKTREEYIAATTQEERDELIKSIPDYGGINGLTYIGYLENL